MEKFTNQVMRKICLFTLAVIAIGFCGMTTLAAPGVTPAGNSIVVNTTIQAAVDSANDGDTIIVRPGTYHESVLVTKNDLTIVGSQGAIIDAAGFRYGIRVGTGRISREYTPPTCPSLMVRNFTLRGLTIRNATFSGVFLIGVSGYHLTGTSYISNPVYGPFPVCSQNGLIDFNSVEGGTSTGGPSTDAGIYVGDDDTVTVEKNFVTNHAVGIEIENSSNAIVRDNHLTGNSTGIAVVVLPGRPTPFTDHVLIEKNYVVQNNLPNPIPAESDDPIGQSPTGTGIINVGADHVLIRENRVVGNDSAGVVIIQNIFAETDGRIEPYPDANEVRGNVILQNGRHPDPERSRGVPGIDIYYDGTGAGTCFAGNIFKLEFPFGVTEFFACP